MLLGLLPQSLSAMEGALVLVALAGLAALLLPAVLPSLRGRGGKGVPRFPAPADAWRLPLLGHLVYVLRRREIGHLDLLVRDLNRMFREEREAQGGEEQARLAFREKVPGFLLDIAHLPFLFLFWPEDIRHATQENFKNYIIGDVRREVIHQFLGSGIFASDDAAWKEKRSLAKPSFQNLSLQHMLPVFHHHAQDLVAHIQRAAQGGGSIDVQNLFMCYTLDCSGEILFHHPIGSLHGNIPFQKAFDYVQVETEKRVSNPFWKVIPAPKYNACIKVCDDFVEDIINKARSDPDLASRNDLLAHFMTALDENGQPHALDNKYLRDTLMNFLIAGRDTTAVTLTWLFYELARNPQVQQKVHEEIKSTFGGGAPQTLEEIRSLKYLKDTINETLRLYPPVPRVLRCSREDDVFPSGFSVAGGTNVVYQPYLLHRLELFWGEDALTFDPDRWGDERTRDIGTYEFLPFHGGPRRCLGFDLAYNEVKMAALMILQRFSVALDESHKVTPQGAITLCAKNGVKVFFHQRA